MAFKLRSADVPAIPQPRAAVRDLRLLARGRGDPPARRPDRPRRPALVGPHGLPHRGLRPDARADDQERGHRPDGRQGRLLPARAPGRAGRAEGRGRAPATSTYIRGAARRHRQPRRRRGRAPRRRARARRGRHLPRRRGRQGHRDVLGHRQPRSPRRYGFWLGDAFASGGSTGYDHKALGITARGAWESVKRHFRELGVDPAVDEFTVVGHRRHVRRRVRQRDAAVASKIRLVAAYDHRHVFIDPDPDAAAGFAERKRLFELAAARRWDDYDRDADLRGRRRLAAQRQAHRAVRRRRARRSASTTRALTPTEVIRAILRAPVDLLWNGGIGTVVKASTETDADAQDRSSDAIRVDADRAALPRGGRGRQPRASPSARGSSSPASGGLHQRRLHRQLGRASTAPTTRST